MSESISVDSLLQWPVYGQKQPQKTHLLLAALNDLTDLHKRQCSEYQTILDKFYEVSTVNFIHDLPFLPVRLFKHHKLLSVPQSDVVKTMTSSGTIGQNVSQIFLDKQTAALQIKVLSRIVSKFIGPSRLPMLVIDCKSTVSNRLKFSARTAGILGFSMFGRDVEFALDDDMTLNLERASSFVAKHRDTPILIFGFTFIVWKHWIRELENLSVKLKIKNGILIHGGGWKQLLSEAVSASEFKNRLNSVSAIKRIHNYYGMVEQTGSIYMECESGHLHTSAWSEIIIRDPADFSELPHGNRGLIQLLSVIPHSYPGHSLLSEDEGEVIGVDDCECGRMGTYFRVHGRVQNAEIRGCSDTYSK